LIEFLENEEQRLNLFKYNHQDYLASLKELEMQAMTLTVSS